MAIGVAGEFKMTNAGICFNDIEGRPTRYAGRGGLGAVLGSKGLKFIVVDSTGANGAMPVVNKDLFDQGRKKLTEAIRTHDITKPKGGLAEFGDGKAVISLMYEIGKGTPLGGILGNGARIGTEILKVERKFNEGAGFTNEDDRIPEFM